MKTYLVGGAVRDRLLGRPGGDRDWVVVGARPDDLMAQGYKPVGRDFPVFLHPRTGEEYALARTERKSGRGYRGFVVDADPSVTLEQDLARRDLTINAIAEDDQGRLIDPFDGAADIRNRVLRHVSDAFVEDPVRLLRLARFAARFALLGFTIADATLDLARAMVARGEIDHLVPERVWNELRRTLTEPSPSHGLRLLRDTGALARLLPELDALYGIPQAADQHPEIDTGQHIERVLDAAARIAPGDALIGFAALLHDLGKALTPASEWPRHIGHEQRGLAPIAAVCDRYRVPGDYRELATLACREHLNIHRLAELRPTSIHDLIARCDGFRRPERIEQLAKVCQADAQGRLGHETEPYPQAALLRSAQAAARAVGTADIDTHDLRGPKIGERLRQARINAIRACLN